MARPPDECPKCDTDFENPVLGEPEGYEQIDVDKWRCEGCGHIID